MGRLVVRALVSGAGARGGTPLRLEFREGENPYKDKHNVLTDAQVRKKQRLMRHVRK